MHAGARIACLATACMSLPACSGDNTNKAASSPPRAVTATSVASGSSRTFKSDAWGFHIDVPAGWTLRRDFRSNYLANAAWKTFAAPDSQGEPVLSLTMPGSNQITDAEIRVGASRAPAEVQRCTTPSSALVAGSIATQRIGGVAFATFEARDAAMSHHLVVHAFRVVHDGACYAIDLLVFGVSPEVYDPPATPPFSDAHAFDAMRAVVQTFAFDQSAASASTAAR